MTTARLSPRDRRTLVIGLTSCAAMIGVVRGLPRWRQWVNESKENAARLEMAVSLAESSSMSGRAAADSLLQRTMRLAQLDTALVEAESPAAAAAALSTMVSDIAEATSVKLGTVRLRVDTTRARGRFVRVGVAANATGDIRGVTDLLVGLEQHFPALSIRELTISQPDIGAPGERPEMLRMDFVVEGLARNNKSPPRVNQ